jgi:hypothetical protein
MSRPPAADIGSSIRPPTATDRGTHRLLWCGTLAAPLFNVTAGIQAALRDGFDLSRHPFSALSVGHHGWVQIANFLLTGLLVFASARGLSRVLTGSRRVRWGTRLVAAQGLGLIGAGVFTTDAADGFPLGTPAGLPETFSWHAIAHGVVTPLAFLAVVAACFVLAVPLGVRYGRAWRVASRLVPVGIVLLMAVPGIGGFSLRLALASALVLGWLAAVSYRVRASLPTP